MHFNLYILALIDIRNIMHIVSSDSFNLEKDSGAFLETRVAGLRRVRIQGEDFSEQPWGYKVL